MKLYVSFFIILIVLSGCQNSVFGVKEDIWHTLTPEQKNNTILAYNKKQTLLAEEKLERQRIEEENRNETNKKINKLAQEILIQFMSGSINFGNTKYLILASEESIEHNNKSIITLKHSPMEPIIPNINLSYENGILYIGEIDKSFKKAIEIPYNSEWQEGKTYNSLQFPFFSKIHGVITLRVTSKKSSESFTKSRSPKRIYRNVDRVFKKLF